MGSASHKDCPVGLINTLRAFLLLALRSPLAVYGRVGFPSERIIPSPIAARAVIIQNARL